MTRLGVAVAAKPRRLEAARGAARGSRTPAKLPERPLPEGVGGCAVSPR